MQEFIINKIADLLYYSAEQPWLFTGISFWIFFAVVVGMYSIVHRKVRARNIYLLLASLFFYYKTGGWFYILLIFSCLSNYGWGYWIGSSKQKAWRITGLVMGLISNLGILVYFKYAYFFTGILNRLTGDSFEVYNWLAKWWNSVAQSHIDPTDIVLPIGISFFTFQAISYLVDVYRKDSTVVKNVFDFSFYLSFFPQLVAGPIVRASSFVPQLYQNYRVTKKEFSHALFLILAGLVKKMVISDFLALNYIDRVFAQPGSFSGAENVMAVYAYSLQIYCDFSGYTDMAIGIALLLGFKLPLNFNSPYKAVSLTDFWHRWHISLSTWLRDYLYIPLGGNRKGKLRTYLNLMFTMLLGGLWHGANIRFVIWGGVHGLGLVIEKILLPVRKRIRLNWMSKTILIFLTFHLVCFAWLFFRAESMTQAREMALQIYYTFNLVDFIKFPLAYPLITVLMAFGFLVHWLPVRWQEFIRGKFIRLPIWVKAMVVLAILYLINQFLLADVQPFIYFRF